MKVAIKPVNNIIYSNKKSTTNRLQTKPLFSPVAQSPSSISFSGLEKLLGLARKVPTKVIPKAIETEQDALAFLKTVETGAVVLLNGKFVKMTVEDYKKPSIANIPLAIIKRPFQPKQSTGIIPSLVIDSLTRGISRLVLVVDDGLHVLTVPNDKFRSAELIGILKNRKIKYKINLSQAGTINDSHFDLTKAMIDGPEVSDIKLEKVLT